MKYANITFKRVLFEWPTHISSHWNTNILENILKSCNDEYFMISILRIPPTKNSKIFVTSDDMADLTKQNLILKILTTSISVNANSDAKLQDPLLLDKILQKRYLTPPHPHSKLGRSYPS